MSDATRTRMSAREFLALPESNKLIELINGEVIVSPSPKDAHQKVSINLVALVLELMPGGELRYSPMDVHLDDYNVVQPDIFWVSGPESLCQPGEDGWWHGAPDLTIEVLSPGAAQQDKLDKFRLYEKHGVREYWIVEPNARYAEVWRLADGQFAHAGTFGANETFESAALGGKMVNLGKVFDF